MMMFIVRIKCIVVLKIKIVARYHSNIEDGISFKDGIDYVIKMHERNLFLYRHI